MNRKMRFILLLAVAAVACDYKRKDVSTTFPSTPFRELNGVFLGMRADELQRARPGATFVPYSGFQEGVDSLSVFYTVRSLEDVSNSDKLTEIFISRNQALVPLAKVVWREVVSRTVAELGPPTCCVQIATLIPANAAEWVVGDQRLTAMPIDSVLTDSGIRRARLTFHVMRSGPDTPNRNEIGCSELLGG